MNGLHFKTMISDDIMTENEEIMAQKMVSPIS